MTVSNHEFDADELSARDAYRLMTDLVAPRPIAWVSTIDAQGQTNLAPFSYYQGVCSSPPTLVLGVGSRPDGRPKDTLANVLETGELTINHVSEPVADAMNRTSAGYPSGISEWEACDVDAVPAWRVRAPRVAGAHGGFECRLTHAIPLGQTKHGGPSSTLLIVEVLHVWLAEGLIERDERGRIHPIDPRVLAAVGRLGGNSFTTTVGQFELERPTLSE